MFEYNGKEYTLAQVEAAASTANLSLDEYIKKASLTTIEPGKTTPTTPDAVVEETAASDQPSMELDSVDTSLDSQEPISIRKKQRLQELEKISLNSIKKGTTSSIEKTEQDKERRGFLGSLAISFSKIPANLQKQELGIRDAILFNLDKLVNPGLSREERIERINEYWNTDDDPMMGFPGLGIIRQADTKEEALDVIKEIRNKQQKTETESLSKAFKEGDYIDSAFLAADGLIQALPSIAFSMYGAGGIAVHGSLIAGEKWGDEILQNPEASELAIASNALATGALQAASDWAFRGLLKNAGVIAKETSAKAAKEYLKNGFLQTAKKFAVIPTEGATEVAQNVANKYLDLYTLGKDFKFSNIKNELIDEFVIGTLMGGSVTLASHLSGASNSQKAYAEGVLMPEDQKAKLNFYIDKYNELGQQYSNESNDLSREQIGLELKNIESNISSLRRKYRTALYSMNSEQLNEYAKNKDRILKIKESIDLSSTPQGRNILFKEIDILNQNNNEIIREAVKNKYNETTAKAEKEAEKLGVKFTKFEKAIEYQNYLESLGGNELYSSNEGVIVQKNGKQEIIINEEAAQDNVAVNVAAHELLHAVLYRTLKGKDAVSVKLGDALINEISKININKVKDSDLANRLRNYLLEPEAIQGEEALTLFSDALATGDIQFNNNIFNSIGDGFRRILQNKGFKSIKFDTGRDVYNFIKDYNKNVEKNNLGKAIEKVAKEGIRGKLVSDAEATAGIETILKESRSQEASDRVQKIYEEQGMAGAMGIIEEFKPITLKIARKRREAPDYNEELLTSEIELGKGGLLDLIQSYKPESGVPLAAYINKNLPLRAITASKKILGEQFTEDVTELRDVAMQEEISRKEEMEEREIAEEIKSLRKQIGLSENLVTKTKDAVVKTFGTKLPSPEDPKFKLALQNAFRVELKTPMAKFVGKQADYENFLRDNFEVIYDKLTINTIAKRFKDFAEPVIDQATGKQAREKTKEGNKIFKKKKLTKAEFIGYFLGSNVGRSTQGTRKTAIVEAIAEEIAFDATMEVLRDPSVTERYLQVSELIGDPLPENFKSLIAKQIDRGEDFKFSKSLPAKFSLTNQELANILIKNTLLEIADGNPDIANAIFDEAFIRSFPATFKDIILPAYKKAINNADEALQIELGKSFIKLFSRPLRTFSYKGSEIKGEYNTNESVFNVLSDLLPDNLVGENGFKLEKVARGKSIFYKNEKIVDLFDVTQRSVLQRVIGKKITKEDFKKQNNHALYELKNLIFNLGESNPGLALSIIKLMQSDNRSIFRQAARLNAVVQNYSGPLRYEHNPPVQHVFNQITDYLTDKTIEKREKLDNLLNTMEANIVPKDFADIVDKKYKTKVHPEGLRYEQAINETNYKFDSPSFKFSKTKITDFNKIIERATGFKTRTKLAEVKADKLAKNKGKFRFFIPPSADDFAGLLYYMTGKGKQGDADLQYFKETFFDPFAKGIAKFDESKQRALANFKELKKLIRKTPARLSKENETGFTNEEVARIYIWNSLGYDIPGITKKDIKEAVKFVKNNEELLQFAQNVKGISILGYPKPDNGWVAGTMTTDLLSYVNETVRADFLKDWKTNVDATLKKPDVLNKLKATYGESYTEALEDILYRMETGRRRPMGSNKLTNQVMNWVNDSVGAIMFFNTRSALLQQLSFVNFINFSDNNPLKAGATFANQKQFWGDYAYLFNSDFLKQRRSGLKTDVNADEIAKAAESGKNPIRSVIASILKKGFLPTQFADSHAIALGGASFYRNRVNRYLKEGKSEKEAQEQAFLDFQEIAEETQQSSRPDRISMQQASPLGRIVLAFANTPMQYARLTKKAALDLANGRGDWKTNLSKLMYYSFIQNVIFTALQGAMFAMIFDETDDEEKEKDTYYRAANNISDSLLRGLGFGGAAVATGKNMILEAIKQYESKRPDYQKVALKALTLSPPIDSKIRKGMAAGRTFTYRQSKEKIRTEGLSLDNPAFEAVGQIISATTNLPADRVVRKLDNLTTPVRQDVEMWQAISLALGYSKWDVGLIESQAKKPKKSTTGLKTKKLKTKKLK